MEIATTIYWIAGFCRFISLLSNEELIGDVDDDGSEKPDCRKHSRDQIDPDVEWRCEMYSVLHSVSKNHVVSGLIAGAMGVGLMAAASGAQAQGADFSFRSVEYMAPSERLPAAQAFLAGSIKAGMPMTEAVAGVRAAGAYCEAPKASGAVKCVASSLASPEDALGDVIWKVSLTPSAGGGLAGATVSRSQYGF
jgi:hypothetical protein